MIFLADLRFCSLHLPTIVILAFFYFCWFDLLKTFSFSSIFTNQIFNLFVHKLKRYFLIILIWKHRANSTFLFSLFFCFLHYVNTLKLAIKLCMIWLATFYGALNSVSLYTYGFFQFSFAFLTNHSIKFICSCELSAGALRLFCRSSFNIGRILLHYRCNRFCNESVAK